VEGVTSGVAAAALVAVAVGGAYSDGLDPESADASSDVADDGDDDDDVGAAASAGSELVRLAGDEAAKGFRVVATTRWTVVGSGAWPVGDGARATAAVAAEAVAAVVAVTAAASTVERGLTR
jgi:hypothetical protein